MIFGKVNWTKGNNSQNHNNGHIYIERSWSTRYVHAKDFQLSSWSRRQSLLAAQADVFTSLVAQW